MSAAFSCHRDSARTFLPSASLSHTRPSLSRSRWSSCWLPALACSRRLVENEFLLGDVLRLLAALFRLEDLLFCSTAVLGDLLGADVPTPAGVGTSPDGSFFLFLFGGALKHPQPFKGIRWVRRQTSSMADTGETNSQGTRTRTFELWCLYNGRIG